MTRSVLISGASIAGPTLAYWLNRYGLSATIVERAPSLRTEGQNVDVRGVGREVLRRMRMEEAALTETTTEEGTAFVDEYGRKVAIFPAATGDTDGATAEVEILRGKLSGLIYEQTKDTVEYVFGDQIAELDDHGDHGDGVQVTFASGTQRDFDLVVLAEGAKSRTRAKVFSGDPRRRMGMYCAYVTIPRTDDDDRYWRWHNALKGRSVHLRPDNTGTTRALLNFLSDTPGLDDLDTSAQTTVLRRVFADAGWETPRVLDALREGTFYFEDLAQVHQASWSRGRVVLLGDAAHCATPISGMGTTLALTGAYVLAGELSGALAGALAGDLAGEAATGRRQSQDRRPSHTQAFERYEQRMRPFVAKAQQLPPGTPWIANPRTRRHRSLLNAATQLISGPVGRAAGSVAGSLAGSTVGRYVTPPADAFHLPDYPVPTGRAHS